MNRLYVNAISDFEIFDNIVKFSLEEHKTNNEHLSKIMVAPICMSLKDFIGITGYFQEKIDEMKKPVDKDNNSDIVDYINPPKKGFKIE